MENRLHEECAYDVMAAMSVPWRPTLEGTSQPRHHGLPSSLVLAWEKERKKTRVNRLHPPI